MKLSLSVTVSLLVCLTNKTIRYNCETSRHARTHTHTHAHLPKADKVSLAGVVVVEDDSDGLRVGPSYHRAPDIRRTGGGLTDKVWTRCAREILYTSALQIFVSIQS